MRTIDLFDQLTRSVDLLRSLAEDEARRTSKLSEAEKDQAIADALAYIIRQGPPKRDDEARSHFAIRKRLATVLRKVAA